MGCFVMMINPGENHQGEITGYQERVYIPGQSSLVMQASRVVLGLAGTGRAMESPEGDLSNTMENLF